MSNTIRQATAGDALRLAEVHVRTWQDAYRGIMPNDYLDELDANQRAQAYERGGVLKDPERPMFVVEDGGLIVGFAGVGPSRDEPERGELYTIYVRSAYWGTGVGGRIDVPR